MNNYYFSAIHRQFWDSASLLLSKATHILVQFLWNHKSLFPSHTRYFPLSISSKNVLVAQSCLTLCDPMDCSLPGSSVHRIEARILEWVAIPFSRGSSWPRDRSQVSCIAGRFFTIWTIREAHISLHICTNSENILYQDQTLRSTIGSGYWWYLNLGSSLVTNVSFWWMMLITDNACVGAMGRWEISVPFSQIGFESKTTLKNSLYKT